MSQIFSRRIICSYRSVLPEKRVLVEFAASSAQLAASLANGRLLLFGSQLTVQPGGMELTGSSRPQEISREIERLAFVSEEEEEDCSGLDIPIQ